MASLGKGLGKKLASALWVLGAAALVLALTVAAEGGVALPDDGPGAPGEPGGEAVFVHRAAPENTSANSTYLHHPSTDDNPDAVLSVTQAWNPGGGPGTYNDHPIGVWYDADARRWAIFNQDRAPLPEGAAFNVVGWAATEATPPGSPTASTREEEE